MNAPDELSPSNLPAVDASGERGDRPDTALSLVHPAPPHAPPHASAVRVAPRSPAASGTISIIGGDATESGCVTFDARLRIVAADEVCAELLGGTVESLTGRSMETCFALHIVETVRVTASSRAHLSLSLERESYRLANVQLESTGRRADLTVRHHRVDGAWRTTVRVHDVGAIGGSEEIIRRLARFSTLARLAPVGIVQLAADGSCLYANAKWSALSRLSSKRSRGFGWIDAIQPDEVDDVIADMNRQLGRDRKFHREMRLRSPQGTAVWVSIEMSALLDDDGRIAGSLLIASDISEKQSLVERLRDMAHKDALTGLWNRAAWLDTLDRCLAADEPGGRPGGRLGVLYIDLDGFKAVNDTVGHDHGDALLKAVAERLSAAVRPDDMLARLGGDEFAVVMSGLADEEAAAAVARRIVHAIGQSFTILGQELNVGASVGIALADDPTLDRATLVKRADTALYAAKHAGRSRHVFYSSEQDRAQRERSALTVAVRRAVDTMAFSLKYQPQIDFASDRLVGFEALLRVDAEAVPAAVDTGTLIEVLENTGLIDPVGRWVLDEACRQFAEWRGKPGLHPEATVSVNVSGRQLGGAGFVEEVARTLERHALPPAALVLEITESVLVGTRDSDVVARLKALGVGIALDDFGQGYSSLAYLGKLPLDRLKIDRSFVEGLTTSEEARKIVSCIVSLACSLGVRVTAEGIEDLRTRDLLHDKGCHDWQGYLYSRPVTPSRVEELLVLEHHRRQAPDRGGHSQDDASRDWLDERIG